MKTGRSSPWNARALIRWFDTGATGVQSERDPDRIDWLRVLPFVGLHLACLGVFWVGVSAVRAVDRAGAVRAAHVRDHRFLPPLLLAPRLPHLARAAVRLRRARRRQRAARTAVVGRAPSPPPSPRRHRARRAFAARTASGAATWAGSSRARGFAHRPRPRSRDLGALPGAALARPLRHPGAGAAGGGAVSASAPGSSAAPGLGTSGAAAAGLGLLRLHRRAVPRHRHHQLAGAPLGHGAASPPATTAATTGCWRCSPSARAGTTTTTISPASARQGFAWWELDLTWYLLARHGRARPGLGPQAGAGDLRNARLERPERGA